MGAEKIEDTLGATSSTPDAQNVIAEIGSDNEHTNEETLSYVPLQHAASTEESELQENVYAASVEEVAGSSSRPGDDLSRGESHDGAQIAVHSFTLNGVKMSFDGNGNLIAPVYHLPHIDSEEEAMEMEEDAQQQAAIQEAMELDARRRHAPLQAQQQKAIMEAMKKVSLQGFVPEWAQKIDEAEWINKLRSKVSSSDQS